MQIFCDESGGCEKGTLVVASVTIDPHIADRFVKDFRKKRKISGELKGSSFSHDDRMYFFEMLDRLDDATSVVVGCTRTDNAGAWLLHNKTPIYIYNELIFQSCAAHLQGYNGSVTIKPDDGKYSAAVMKEIEISLHSRFIQNSQARFSIQFSESSRTSGVQIADVISNTTYKEVAAGNFDLSDNAYCGGLWRGGRLQFRNIDLGEDRPEWLEAAE